MLAPGVQFTLPNGLSIVMLEDHEVPTVKGQLLMGGGQRASPADKVGMCPMLCMLCLLLTLGLQPMFPPLLKVEPLMHAQTVCLSAADDAEFLSPG